MWLLLFAVRGATLKQPDSRGSQTQPWDFPLATSWNFFRGEAVGGALAYPIRNQGADKVIHDGIVNGVEVRSHMNQTTNELSHVGNAHPIDQEIV